MKYSKAIGRTLGAMAVSALLASCGGGGGEAVEPSVQAAPAAAAPAGLQGVVVDGYVEGARVFLDLNNNQSYDDGEPLATSGSGGAFALRVEPLSAGQLASTLLVAEVPETARDSDDQGRTLKEAGRAAYTMMSPAASFLLPGGGQVAPAVISPLTTLVAAEVAFNGMTPQEAQATVREQHALGSADLMADYVARGDGLLRNYARTAAVAAGEAASALQRAADADATEPRERIAETQRQLRKRLPQLARQLNLATGGQVAVADVKRGWSATQPQAAPRRTRPAPDGLTRIIVRLQDDVADPQQVAQALAGAYGGDVRHTYRRAVKGFAVDVPEGVAGDFVTALQADTRVDSVEEDQMVAVGSTLQSGATWGIDRIDQRALPLSGSYSYDATGAGVHAYIIDSGLRSTQVEFTGRVKPGYTAIYDGRGTNDCHGHGTHVAGTVGGTTWGVAKGVTVVPVRVLACDNTGAISGIIAGLDWMVANAVRPAVANMSIGAGASSTLDAAVERAVSSGITVAIAAGNDGANACNYSPARTPNAITVGATTGSDARASWSNYGTCLDVFAPGQSIVSAGISSDLASYTMSGTSMATPHVAGFAALLLQQNPALTPAQVVSSIRGGATTGTLSSVGSGSPNLMLYASAATADSTPVTTSPETTSSPSLYMAVAALSGSAVQSSRRYWQARATIAVKDEYDRMVPGVVVQGGFSVGGSSLSCTTASNGTCVITSGRISRTTPASTFAVAGLARTGVTYMPAYNAASSVVIARP